MKKALLMLFAAALLVVIVPTTACNNGSCDFVSKCSNDPAMTADDVTACNNKVANPTCGGYYAAYLGCYQSHQTCTETGVTDLTITNGTCGVQLQQWLSCCFGTDGGVAASDGGFPQCGQ